MTAQPSTLRQVLTIFETAHGALSLPQVARELDISLERLDGMIQYWVRKGKIRNCLTAQQCGSCGFGDACPFVVDMPRIYELVDEHSNPIDIPIMVNCGHKPDGSSH